MAPELYSSHLADLCMHGTIHYNGSLEKSDMRSDIFALWVNIII
jgi:hypothetical protein